jgi:hypothetical protein
MMMMKFDGNMYGFHLSADVLLKLRRFEKANFIGIYLIGNILQCSRGTILLSIKRPAFKGKF